MSDPADRPERRAAPRIPVGQLQAQLDVPRPSDVLLLSTSGMAVKLDFMPEIGSRHHFTLRFPDRNLEVHGIVRNGEHHPGSAGQFRVGVEFADLSEETAAFLKDFVAERLSD
jgi:PilZ domain-containing protein